MKSFTLTMACLLGLSQAAVAEGLGASEHASYAGAYAGIGVGAASADGVAEIPLIAGATRVSSYDPGTGRTISGHAGYNWQDGRLVYGGEFVITNYIDLTDEGILSPETQEIIRGVDLRARLGYVTGDFLLYGALGWSLAEFRVHPGTAFGGRSNETNVTGLSYGVGVEYAIHENWSVGADIMLRDLSGQFGEAFTDSDVDLNTFSLRAQYRF